MTSSQRLGCAVSILLMALTSGPANGQWFSFGAKGGASPVWLTGNYRILGQASSRQGTFQEQPPDIWRAELNPTLSLYGLPVTANLLVSSEQRDIRQNINAFSVTLDPDAIKRIVAQRATTMFEAYARSEAGELLDRYDSIKDSLSTYDPEKLKELEQYRKIQEMRELANGDITNYSSVLQEMGLMSDVEDFMQKLPTVGFGTVFPTFSPLTLSGARVSGGWGEWNPGGVFYIAGVSGTTQRPLYRVDSIRIDTTVFRTVDNSDFGRQLYGGRLGFGRQSGAHFIFTGLYATDDALSLTLPDSGVTKTPQRNYISSFSVRSEPVKGIWSFEAELAGSLTEGDQSAPRIGSPEVPDFLNTLIDSSVSAYIDWAFTGSTTVNLASSGTRLVAKIRRIGAGYNALGVPNLRTDYIRYDARIDQKFWKRQLSVGAFIRHDEDNLADVKRSTSTLSSWGANIGLNIRTWPFIRLSYSPYTQVNNSRDTFLQYRNETVIWSVVTGHAYRLGTFGANTTLTLTRQDAETKNHVNDYAVMSANLSQSLSFTIPLTLSAGLGYIVQKMPLEDATSIVTVDGAAAYAISESFSTSGGVTLAFDSMYGTRSGFYLSLLAQLGDYADIDLRVERNIFNESVIPPVLGGSYTENIFRLTIGKIW